MNVPDPVRTDDGDMHLIEQDGSYRVVVRDIVFPFKGPGGYSGPLPQPVKKATREFPVATAPEHVRRPTWTQLIRAVVVLERIGTPEALELLKEMATGHPDALPTRTAKEAVEKLTAPPP
jgi:hypothetical protein